VDDAVQDRIRRFYDLRHTFATRLVESGVKGRAFGSPLARGLYPRASTAEVDPRAKPGAPAAVELITVKELPGHSTVKITERYTHPHHSLKKEAVGLLD
jgi:integrase